MTVMNELTVNSNFIDWCYELAGLYGVNIIYVDAGHRDTYMQVEGECSQIDQFLQHLAA